MLCSGLRYPQSINIKTLKVRQRKGVSSHHKTLLVTSDPRHALAAQTVMCAPQLQAMLGCWAATQDLHSIDKCKGAADSLFQCMRTTVSSTGLAYREHELMAWFIVCPASTFSFFESPPRLASARTQPMPKKAHRPTINYHLARLGKTIQ